MVTDEQIQKWADEAEAGYDVELQEFEITYTETLRDSLVQTGPVSRELGHTVFTYSPSALVTDARFAPAEADGIAERIAHLLPKR